MLKKLFTKFKERKLQKKKDITFKNLLAEKIREEVYNRTIHDEIKVVSVSSQYIQIKTRSVIPIRLVASKIGLGPRINSSSWSKSIYLDIVLLSDDIKNDVKQYLREIKLKRIINL
jgi:hypothetical protein